ncbi:MAG: hypothetical protein NBV68_17980 [Erythrobacter sp.]|nr:hypothetical protein [Erythrobacter sp.]
MTGYAPTPWPCEDGGPARMQALPDGLGLPLERGVALQVTARRVRMTTMTVLGAPGEVFLLTHNALRSQIGLATHARVERIDPVTLRPLVRSPRLPGGPMWPGGMALHANGDLVTVYGRWAHRLGRDCTIKAARRLPENAPYNSFVTLDCGLIVTKNLSDHAPAMLSVLDPDSLAPVCAPVACPEPSIARLSAVGETVYLVGTASIMRFDWDGTALRRDPDWRHFYLEGSGNSYGWDAVIADGHAWFMDNGHHRYRLSMIGRGLRRTPNRLIRVALDNSDDVEAVTVSRLPGGSITNPPLVDPARRIVVAYDSANRVIAAWRYGDGPLQALWRREGIGCASHLLLDPARGLVITNDYAHRREAVIALDITTGETAARIVVGGMLQGVVFPSPGWAGDIYWCSMGRLARVFVAASASDAPTNHT